MNQTNHRCLGGKVALITGGNTGIGRRIALEFAQHGASIVIASRPHEGTDECLRDIRACGVDGLFSETDVADYESVTSTVSGALARFSKIDVLVNNAGILGPLGSIETTSPVEWEQTIRVNLLGTYFMCRAVAPVMRRQTTGKIINLAGGGATAPLPCFSAYASSKAAIVRFTEVMAQELADSNIQVNAISPGVVMTAITESILANLECLPEWEQQYFAAERAKGGDSPALAARLALFLASPESEFVSGKNLSAVWDDVSAITRDVLSESSALFTLRRIDNKEFVQRRDRG